MKQFYTNNNIVTSLVTFIKDLPSATHYAIGK